MTKLRDILSNIKGVTALEFALLAPIYFMPVMGTVEIGIVSWYRTILDDGVSAGIIYLRDTRLAGNTITDAGLRAAICNAVSPAGISCDTARLKIATHYAGAPDTVPINLPKIVANRFDSRMNSESQFILAIGYDWSAFFPTTPYVLTTEGSAVQIQNRGYVSIAERPSD